MNNLRIKVCGMRDTGNIEQIASLMPDLMGFVFYPPSARYAGNIPGERMFSNFPETILKTGVFVNESLNVILEHVQNFGLDVVQLHGNENPDFCFRLFSKGIRVIKAFGIVDEMDPGKLIPYVPCTNWFLFDTSSKVPGGSGEKFNWELLDKYDLGHPFFLSGGIEPGDIEKIRKFENPALHGIDINSKFEVEPGIKDFEKVRDFVEGLRVKV